MSDDDLIDTALDDIIDAAIDVSDSASNDLVEAEDDIDHALEAVLDGKSPARHLARAKAPKGKPHFEPNDPERIEGIYEATEHMALIRQRVKELTDYRDQVVQHYPELTQPAAAMVELAQSNPQRYLQARAVADFVIQAEEETGKEMLQLFDAYGTLCDQEFDARYPDFNAEEAIETLRVVGVDLEEARSMYFNGGSFTLHDQAAQNILALAACQWAGKNLIGGDDDALGHAALNALFQAGFSRESASALLQGASCFLRDYRCQCLIAEATNWRRHAA